MTTFVTGQAAAEATGLSITEIDQAAASGAIPAEYQGWRLMVDPTGLVPDEEKRTVPELKQVLDERGVEYPAKALKAELIGLVEQTE